MGYQREVLVKLAAELVSEQPWLTEAEASERLGVYRHTLQRALKANGWDFASIRQACVLERLERHFAGGKVASLKQVWTELGFASASAFARYVRQATGKSPSQLRADHALGHSTQKRSGMSLGGRGGGE